MDCNEDRTDTEDSQESEDGPSEETRIYRKFVEENGQSDLTLIVEDYEIPVCKAVLCVASPVFRTMLQSNFKEKDQDEITLPEKRFKDFVEFLNCIYPDKMKHVTGKTVYRILPLAMEYQVTTLADRCERILVALVKYVHITDAKEIFKHIQLSEKYELQCLNDTCILVASELKLDNIEEANETYPIKAESMIKLKDLALMRHELDKNDDKMVSSLPQAKRCPIESVRKSIIESAKFSPFKGEILRARRLYARFFPNDTTLLKIITKIKKEPYDDEADEDDADDEKCEVPDNLPRMDLVEQMNLLPETLKQKLPREFQVDTISKALMRL